MYKYLEIPIEQLKEGMVAGRTIENQYGRHLVEKDSLVDRYIIDELTEYGIQKVLVKLVVDGSEEDLPMAKTAEYAIRELRKPDAPTLVLENSVKKRIAKGVEAIHKNPDSGDAVNTARWITDELMKAIEENCAVAVNINALRCSDEYTFNHSIDVAAISMMIAQEQKRSKKDIYDICIAGLLHDIGKMKVPSEILNKPGKLTKEEFEIMKMHSYYSYQTVANSKGISFDVKAGILQHHEKINGTGYPHGLVGDCIHPYSKILAVSDIFDALITERPYKTRKTQREAVEMLMAMTGELDFYALQSFMRVLIIYPVDSIVRLSNGEAAKVVRQNEGMLLRPVVVGIHTGNIYDLSAKECAGLVIE